MIVTTPYRETEILRREAMNVATALNTSYYKRGKRTINEMIQHYQEDIMVVGVERLEYFEMDKEKPLFFHPNSAMFRIKRLIQKEEDPLIRVSRLHQGMTFLDCTLGLGSDSIVASYVVGSKGKVVGIENSTPISYIVGRGLQTYNYNLDPELEIAMRRIRVENKNALDYLRLSDNRSFDVVYFDPMFSKPIGQSNGIDPLRKLATYEEVSEECIGHALRVAKSRVVLKAHFQSPLFNQYRFNVEIRKSAKFHFGWIDIARDE